MREKDLRRLLTRLGVQVTALEDGWLICRCCFTWKHKKGRDETPSLGIRVEPNGRSGYHCWSCHSKGSLPNLVFQLAKNREDDDLRKLGRKIEMDEILGSDEVDFPDWGEYGKVSKTSKSRIRVKFPNEREEFYKYPAFTDSDAAVSYLRGRRISIDTGTEVGLRFDPRQQRLLFPVWDYSTGRLAGFSGRSILSDDNRKRQERRLRERYGDPKLKIPKVRDYAGLTKRAVLLGRPRPRIEHSLYATNELVQRTLCKRLYTGEQRIILVEGLFAYLRLTQLGFTNCLALLGSELTIEKADILRDIGKAVYWFVDNDLAGEQCMYGSYNHEEHIFEGNGGLQQLFGDVAQFTVTWPEGKADPDDLTKKEVEYMIDTADLYTKGFDKTKRKD